jgi:hypothetical protein
MGSIEGQSLFLADDITCSRWFSIPNAYRSEDCEHTWSQLCNGNMVQGFVITWKLSKPCKASMVHTLSTLARAFRSGTRRDTIK